MSLLCVSTKLVAARSTGFALSLVLLPRKRLSSKRVSQRLDAVNSSFCCLWPACSAVLPCRSVLNARTWLDSLASSTTPAKNASGSRPSSTQLRTVLRQKAVGK